MKRKKKHAIILYVFLSVLICLSTVAAMVWEYNHQVQIRKKDAEHVLLYQKENMELILKDRLNYPKILSAPLMRDLPDIESFREDAKKLAAEHAEIRYINLFTENKLICAFPEERFGADVGAKQSDFPYVYSMRGANDAFIVEGPTELHRTDETVFLFLKPIWREGKYWGQIAVALDSAYVFEQLHLEALREQGYEYALWNVELQDGGKRFVRVSNETADFSYGAKIAAYLPAQWTLTIYPVNGWISFGQTVRIVVNGILLAGLVMALLFLLRIFKRQRDEDRKLLLLDRQTALYNRHGFVKTLDLWIEEDGVALTLFYFVVHDFNRVSQLVTLKEEEEFLAKTANFMEGYAISNHLLGRVGESNFILAIQEELTEQEAQDIAKGLSLEIFWRIRVDGKKIFLNTQYQCARYPQDGKNAAELLHNVARLYYDQMARESSIHQLTENCLRLLKGEVNVAFGEYTNQEMMRLSKAIHQYRKRAEQLAYHDPVLNVGNRLCYSRDARLLISYDAKRAFTLYCIDICSFSRFNELFSVETGDMVLKEVARCLSELFGKNLYRISGDVFLGLSLEGEQSETRMAEQICGKLHEQIAIEDLRFRLKAKIGVCTYPLHARTPEKLLEGVQIALHHAKQSSNRTLMVYNNRLTDILRRESQILELIEESLSRQTLEVWFQPIANMETQRFSAAEALLRLKDKNGIYLPTDEVIAIAERNRMMDRVGVYVLQRACAAMKKMEHVEGFSRMGVNLSVQQLMVEGCVEDILSQIRDTGVDFSRIALEVTESVLIQSFKEAEEILSQLQKKGIHIALDDFGVGYSSLNYLSNLPVDVLKIDRKLTRQIVGSPKQYALLKAVLEMARVYDIDVIVEGVENEVEQAMVAAVGVKLIQGYYYARPMPESALREAMEKGFSPKKG